MRMRPTSGTTLIEVTIVTVLIVPLLMVLGAASKTVVGSLGTSASAAEVTQLLTGTTARAAAMLQSGQSSTLRVEALAEDVAAGRATAVGQWIRMHPGDVRRSIELQSAMGGTGPALVIPTTTYRLQFTLDASEVANGIDDDGDGLVDEGELTLSRGSDRIARVGAVESCSFELDGRALRYAIRVATKKPSGVLHRITIEQSVYLRNL